MLPEDTRTLYGMASKRCKMLDKFVVCYLNGLGEYILTKGYIVMDATIDDKVV